MRKQKTAAEIWQSEYRSKNTAAEIPQQKSAA